MLKDIEILQNDIPLILSNIQNDEFATRSCIIFILLVLGLVYIWGHESLSCLQRYTATAILFLILIFYIDYRRIR